MRNKLTVFILFFASFLSAQTSSFVADRIRAAEYFRIGANSSQKVTGFNTSISGAGSNEKLPTTKAVVDYLTAGFVPIGYYTEGTGIDITGGVISNTIPELIFQDEGTSLPSPMLRLNAVGDGILLSTVFASQTARLTLDADLNNLASNTVNGILTRTGIGAGGITGRTITAGTGISITNGDGVSGNPTITNTSPNIVQTLSIAGQDLTLSNGGGTVAIPGGASDALGTGFTSGGGTGTIPAGTTIQVQSGGDFILDLSAPMANGDISYIGDVGTNVGINISGNTFTLQAGNGGMTISADDEKVVLTGNGAVFPNLTTAQRNALTGLSVGQTIYNTDATANDSSTGVMQVWNGAAWKNAW